MPTDPRHVGFDKLKPTDHTWFLFRHDDELRDAVHAFTQAALARDHAALFVHRFGGDAEALAFLRGGPDYGSLLDRHFFLLARHGDAFEGTRGVIDYQHVTRTVADLLGTVRATGRQGLSIFVDASRSYLASRRHEEWFAFERWLGQRLRQQVGLVCAYAEADLARADVRRHVETTHMEFGNAAP